MKKMLNKTNSCSTYYFDFNRNKIYGIPEWISGDVSGIYGNVTGISGNLDSCEITESDRTNGIDINDLII